MGSPYQLFQTSQKAEDQGILVDYGDFAIRIKRAGEGNKEFRVGLQRLLKKYRIAFEIDAVNDAQILPEFVALFANFVLVDWVNVTDQEGNLIPFTAENAKKLLLDLPALFVDLRTRATDYKNFRAQEIEETAGN